MKFSESWLRTLVAPELSSEALSHLLTMAGLEVEELDPVAPQFNDVVVAHVLEVTKHPDADRLNVCKVDTGRGEPTIIVCGAPNVAVGLRVPCALPGARLPGDFVIKIAKVRRMLPLACAFPALCPAPGYPAISSSRSPRYVASNRPACFVQRRSSALPKRLPGC